MDWRTGCQKFWELGMPRDAFLLLQMCINDIFQKKKKSLLKILLQKVHNHKFVTKNCIISAILGRTQASLGGIIATLIKHQIVTPKMCLSISLMMPSPCHHSS